MEHQKIINLLGSINNEPSKLRTKKCVKVNDESCGKNATQVGKLNLKLRC